METYTPERLLFDFRQISLEIDQLYMVFRHAYPKDDEKVYQCTSMGQVRSLYQERYIPDTKPTVEGRMGAASMLVYSVQRILFSYLGASDTYPTVCALIKDPSIHKNFSDPAPRYPYYYRNPNVTDAELENILTNHKKHLYDILKAIVLMAYAMYLMPSLARRWRARRT